MARISKLNISEVMSELNLFLSGSDGKDFISGFSSGSNSSLISKKDAFRMAEELKKIIVTYAGMEFTTSQLSVFNSINDIRIGDLIENGDGTYKIDLDLSGDLRRPSLNPNDPGAENIVALFIHGWKPKGERKQIWGQWHGKMVGSRTEKDPMNFAENAIETFNRQYEHLGAHAELNDEYK